MVHYIHWASTGGIYQYYTHTDTGHHGLMMGNMKKLSCQPIVGRKIGIRYSQDVRDD